MPWQEITFDLISTELIDYEDALMSLGALSITLRDAEDQPLLEPPPEETPVWDKVLLTAMFDGSSDPAEIAGQLREKLSLSVTPQYRVVELEDREWHRTWMDYFKPISFGNRLWICPSGYDCPEDDDAVIINLDPGLAFGTGSHPTTALCMAWLDQHELRDKVVVDFGCGSGILAIAAAKLGAKHVYAIDNDPQALQATQSNSKQNAVDDIVQLSQGSSIMSASTDILVANILLKPLLELRNEFFRLLAPGGQLVLSGLLAEQQQELQEAYQEQFEFGACEQMQEWVRLTAVRRY
jgi:ribosomal protein L11 methyltransferase